MNRLNQTYNKPNIYTQHYGVETGYPSSDEQVQWTCEPKPSEFPTLMTNLHYSSSGKEKDAETGLSYFGARYYEPEMLNIWLSVDPMADKYPNMSPYNYCAWSPVKAIDPLGMDSIHTPKGVANAGEGYHTTPDGKYLYGEGLRTKKWNPNLEIGGIVGESGGYEDCCQSDLSGFQVSLAAGGALESLDEVVGVGSDGYCYYGRTKYDELTPGTARNRVQPLSKSIPGRFMKHGANILSVLWSVDEVRINYKGIGPNSPEFYSSAGGLIGTTASIWTSTYIGALAGSAFGGLGAVPGAIAGFAAGTASSVAFDLGGRKAGEAFYKKTH